MFSEDNLENRLQSQEIALNKLRIAAEALEQNVQEFLSQHPIPKEKLDSYLTAQENFTKEEWMLLLEMKQRLDEKLQLSLSSIKDPKKTRAALKDLNASRNWLFVR